jgi:hypothetical protein
MNYGTKVVPRYMVRILLKGTCQPRQSCGDTILNIMEDQQPEFTPTIIEDRTPGSVVILSSRLAERLKARRDAEESAVKPEDNEPNTATTP